MAENKFPTEMVELPSKGYFYFDGHPLSSGKVEVKYMTAKEEDILTSQNLIQQGVVIDKLMQSLIVDKSTSVRFLNFLGIGILPKVSKTSFAILLYSSLIIRSASFKNVFCIIVLSLGCNCIANLCDTN